MPSPFAPLSKYTADLQVEHLGQQRVQLLRVSVGDPCEAALADFLGQLLLVASSERRSKPGPKDTRYTLMSQQQQPTSCPKVQCTKAEVRVRGKPTIVHRVHTANNPETKCRTSRCMPSGSFVPGKTK